MNRQDAWMNTLICAINLKRYSFNEAVELADQVMECYDKRFNDKLSDIEREELIYKNRSLGC